MSELLQGAAPSVRWTGVSVRVGTGMASRRARAPCAFRGRPLCAANGDPRTWGRGRVDIRLIGIYRSARVSVRKRESRRYTSVKYVGKAIADGRRVSGLHRYEVAQGFQPQPERLCSAAGRKARCWIGRRMRWGRHRSRCGAPRRWRARPAWAASVLGVVGLTTRSSSLAHEWARRSCADQGVPVKVTDPGTLGHVARLLGGETVGVRRLPAPPPSRPRGRRRDRRDLRPGPSADRWARWNGVESAASFGGSSIATGHLVRRTVIDYETGEIIDDAWHDNEGRVRTYSAPKDVPARRSDSPYRLDARGVEAVVASSSGADDGMVEHRRDDSPAAASAGGMADVSL